MSQQSTPVLDHPGPTGRRPRTPFGLRRQVRLLLPLLGTWLAGTVVLAAAGTQQWAPLKELFLDASYLGGQPWYSGILNEASIVAWSAAGTAAALGAWIAGVTGRRGAARFLAGGALVALMLLLDVWIQFHSAVAPRLGVSSNQAQTAQALLGGLWVIAFLREIARTRWLVLYAAFGALAMSGFIDMIFEPAGSWGLMLEDGARLLGVLAFAHYMVLTTVDIIRSVTSSVAAPQH
ncbi:MAG: hypothetical protein JNL54_10070 [Kineosporiaceae bacterium]|nr:hypothetical protein [Kineosporiaceae bacterium]